MSVTPVVFVEKSLYSLPSPSNQALRKEMDRQSSDLPSPGQLHASLEDAMEDAIGYHGEHVQGSPIASSTTAGQQQRMRTMVSTMLSRPQRLLIALGCALASSRFVQSKI